MRNGGRVLLEVQNLYVRIKIHEAIFDTNHSVTPDTLGIYSKRRRHGVYHFDFLKFNNDLNFLLSEISLKCT